MWYVEVLGKTCNERDRTFYDAINYNIANGWYLTSAPIITADWKANSDNLWTVPFGGGVGKIMKFGKLPVNGQLSVYYNAESPEYGAGW